MFNFDDLGFSYIFSHSSEIPLFSALVLGFIAAVCPCSIALSITAIGYIVKDIKDKRRVFLSGMMYTLGRTVCYVLLSILILFVIKQSHIVNKIEHDLGFIGERMVGPLLIVVGILLLDIIKFKLIKINLAAIIEKRFPVINLGSSFIIGFLFALAFCPYNAVLFFGTLIPVASTSDYGYVLPFIYAFASGLPVVIVSWLLAYSFSNIGNFYSALKKWELIIRRVIAVLIIIGGVYYTITLSFMEHNHVH